MSIRSIHVTVGASAIKVEYDEGNNGILLTFTANDDDDYGLPTLEPLEAREVAAAMITIADQIEKLQQGADKAVSS